jgi:hypothetical protein
MTEGQWIQVVVDPEVDPWLGELTGRVGRVVKTEPEEPLPGRKRGREIVLVHLSCGTLEWFTASDCRDVEASGNHLREAV